MQFIVSNNKVVLKQASGGIGDALLWSSCVKRWVKEFGYEVYIENAGWRSEDIPRLIWQTNPYVSGIQIGGTTHALGDTHDLRKLCMAHGNNVAGAEAYMGFGPTFNTLPESYYQPVIIEALKDKVLVDPVAYTQPFTDAVFRPFIQHLISHELIKRENILVLDTLYPANHILSEFPRYPVGSDLFGCTNAIASCHTFVTVHSGLSAIASALRQRNEHPRVLALMSQAVYNSKVFTWDNLEYFITGKLNEDFQLL